MIKRIAFPVLLVLLGFGVSVPAKAGLLLQAAHGAAHAGGDVAGGAVRGAAHAGEDVAGGAAPVDVAHAGGETRVGEGTHAHEDHETNHEADQNAANRHPWPAMHFSVVALLMSTAILITAIPILYLSSSTASWLQKQIGKQIMEHCLPRWHPYRLMSSLKRLLMKQIMKRVLRLFSSVFPRFKALTNMISD